MSTLWLPLPGNERLAAGLAARLGGGVGRVETRRFPDGEAYARIDDDVHGRDVAIAATLDRCDEKLVPLLLVAGTARELGASRVGLVAPYLPYLRQDARFRTGEAVSSRIVGAALSRAVDWVATVDPHLHRHASLSEAYAVPAAARSASPAIARWVAANVDDPLVVGPDAESAQWARAVADAAGAPCVVLAKTRRGDREVEIAAEGLARWRGRTPVLVDDIVSTGRTMAATIARLREAGLRDAVCVAVHAVFAGRAHEELREAGAARVVTCDTIEHPTNAIEVVEAVAEAARDARARAGAP